MRGGGRRGIRFPRSPGQCFPSNLPVSLLLPPSPLHKSYSATTPIAPFPPSPVPSVQRVAIQSFGSFKAVARALHWHHLTQRVLTIVCPNGHEPAARPQLSRTHDTTHTPRRCNLRPFLRNNDAYPPPPVTRCDTWSASPHMLPKVPPHSFAHLLGALAGAPISRTAPSLRPLAPPPRTGLLPALRLTTGLCAAIHKFASDE